MAKIKLTKWQQATLYHLCSDVSIDQISNLPSWSSPTKSQVSTFGIVPIYDKHKATPINNSGTWFRLRYSVRKPNTSELKRRFFARIETLKGKGKGQVDSVKLNKTEDQAIQAEIRDELTKETPPSHTEVDVMLSGDWFIITSASATMCDMVTQFMIDNLEQFSVSVAKMMGDEPLTDIGMNILESDDLIVGNIELGTQIKTKSEIGNVAISNADYDEDMLNVLRSASEVQSMTVGWSAGYTAKVNSDFSFSGVQFEVVTDHIEGDDDQETAHLRDQERAKEFVTNMPLFLKDLAVHCEGLAPLPDVEAAGAEA